MRRSASRFAAWIIVPCTILFAAASVFHTEMGFARGYLLVLLVVYLAWQLSQATGFLTASVTNLYDLNLRMFQEPCAELFCACGVCRIRPPRS